MAIPFHNRKPRGLIIVIILIIGVGLGWLISHLVDFGSSNQDKASDHEGDIFEVFERKQHISYEDAHEDNLWDDIACGDAYGEDHGDDFSYEEVCGGYHPEDPDIDYEGTHEDSSEDVIEDAVKDDATDGISYKGDIVLVYVDDHISSADIDMIEAVRLGSDRLRNRVVSVVSASDEQVCDTQFDFDLVVGRYECSDWEFLADSGRFDDVMGGYSMPLQYDRPSNMIMAIDQAVRACDDDPTDTCELVVIASQHCWLSWLCGWSGFSDQHRAVRGAGHTLWPIVTETDLGVAVPKKSSRHQWYINIRVITGASIRVGLGHWDDDIVDWVDDLPTAVEKVLAY